MAGASGTRRTGWLLILGLGAVAVLSALLIRIHVGPPPRYPITCPAMLRQLCLGMRIYANDNGGVLPPAARWCDALLPIMKRVEMFQCPQYDAKYGYAMNARLSGKRLEDLADPASTVILFDSTTGKRNAHDEGESWPVPPRHKDGMNCVAFADGRAECLRTKPDFRVRMKGGEPQVGAERSSAAERPTGASVAGGRRSE